MFNSNSQKELYNTICSKCSDTNIADKTYQYVKHVCVNNSLNFDKVADEISRIIRRTQNISSMYNYVKGVISNLDFKKYGNAIVEHVPITQPLINDLRNKGVVVLADDSVWISVVWEHLVNFKEINVSVLQALNQKILKFMKTKDFSEYKELLVKSNTLKNLNINWQLLEFKTQEKIKEWNSILDGMESQE